MRRLTALLLLLALLLGGCAAAPGETAGLSYTDELGQELTIPYGVEAAVLSGSFAELWQLAGGTLAAVTDDAIEERDLELGEDVVRLGSLKQPDLESLILCKAPVAFLSADLEGHVALKDALLAAGTLPVYLKMETFEDYLRLLKLFTTLTGEPERYETYGEAVREQVDGAIALSQGRPAPTVLLLRAYSSGVKAKGADNVAGAILRDLGCVNLADNDESLLENLSLEAIVDADPDHIFITTMGASTEDALAALEEQLTSHPAWASLTAVREGRVVVLSKELFHYKPNHRWGESYQYLAEILYGEN